MRLAGRTPRLKALPPSLQSVMGRQGYSHLHDNAPLLAWKDEVDPKELEFAKRYLGLNKTEGLNYGMIRGGMGSVAALFVAQMQDYLVLGADKRMNTPDIPHGNWTWRLLPGEADRKLAERIHELCRIYSRLTEAREKAEEAAAEAARAAAEKAAGKKPEKSPAKKAKKAEGGRRRSGSGGKGSARRRFKKGYSARSVRRYS